MLPGPEILAALVSNVTETICGTRFVPASDDLSRGQSICGRMVMLPIPGDRDISLILSCDATGSQALAAALHNRPAEQLTRAMIDDAISEFLNMVAGQIQRALDIDQQLGLPRPTSLAEMAQMGGVGFDDSILLTSQGLGDLKLWIFEKTAPTADVPTPAKQAGAFRSLFRKIGSRN